VPNRTHSDKCSFTTVISQSPTHIYVHTVQNTFQILPSVYSALQPRCPSLTLWQGWLRTCAARTLGRRMSLHPREHPRPHRVQRAIGSYSLRVSRNSGSYLCSSLASQLSQLHPCREALSVLGQSVVPCCLQVLCSFSFHQIQMVRQSWHARRTPGENSWCYKEENYAEYAKVNNPNHTNIKFRSSKLISKTFRGVVQHCRCLEIKCYKGQQWFHATVRRANVVVNLFCMHLISSGGWVDTSMHSNIQVVLKLLGWWDLYYILQIKVITYSNAHCLVTKCLKGTHQNRVMPTANVINAFRFSG